MQLKPRLKRIRQASQIICLSIFLVLFRLTDYSGSDTIPYAVNILFRLDPLVLATAVLAKKTFILLLWPAFIVITLTLVFGRVFCSWICPMGTLLDAAGKVIPVAKKRLSFPGLKYYLLAVILTASVFGVQLLGFFDPFSILVRSLAFSLDPGLRWIVSGFFDTAYQMGPSWLSDLTEPVYDFLKTGILPYKQNFFYLSLFSFVIFLFLFVLERYGKRFWCRNLCPLGGLLALVTRFSIFKRVPGTLCRHCGSCASGCSMDVFDTKNQVRFEECTLCLDCLEFCPDGLAGFKFTQPFYQKPAPDIDRRRFLAAGLTGVALPVVMRTDSISKTYEPALIRPPGAGDEIDFLGLCVRCGECMKVCINNGLQPLFLEKGLEGMFTPVLVPRLGYCEFNCTLCSQVCPTGALERLDKKKKHGVVIGKAVLDKDRCLVYKDKKGCIVCEEHCPTHKKAIRFDKIQTIDFKGNLIYLKQPYVDETLCIGCGICEYVCPVQGQAAVRVEAGSNQYGKGMY